MAEARLAVAFQFAVNDDGELNIHFDKDVVRQIFRGLGKAVKRRAKSVKHALLKWHFPATPLAWVLFFFALAAARVGEHQPTLGVLGQLEEALPSLIHASPYIAVCVGVAILATFLWMLWGISLQMILRALLTYRGVLFERKLSLKSKIWAGFVKVFASGHATLYSYQQSLPRLPVPSLDDTLDKHLVSVKPIFSEEKYKRVEDLTEEFRNGVGRKLQRYLVLKSWWANNYVTDWWTHFVYMKSQGPIMINSNFYGLDGPFSQVTTSQVSKAGNIIHAMFLFRKMLEKEKLKPLMANKLIPLCSTQYRPMFNSTRIPGKEHDEFVHRDFANHIVVSHNGRLFKLILYHRGVLLKPKDIESQFERILQDTSTPAPGEQSLAALTGNDRKVWAEARETYFATGVNEHALHIIESAAFFVVLTDNNAALHDKEDPSTYTDFARDCFHGTGGNIWFDKSFNLLVFKNGRIGFNCEHSWADAPIMSQLYEWISHYEITKLGYDENGRCKGEPEFSLNPPERLKFELPDKCIDLITTAKDNNIGLINDLDIRLLVFDEFGKDVIKKCKVSPDAFIQMSYQLANYRDVGSFSLTYESAMTRLYKDGRTETVRSCTAESCAFVRAMMDPDCPKETRKELFVKAASLHAVNLRKAMAAQGVDRHLFCLYVVSKYMEIDSPFLTEILSEPWKLSTSQTASVQMGLFDFGKEPEKIPGGGGFGPVADDGYGLCYMVTDHALLVHVTCKKSSNETNAVRMAGNIRKAFWDIKELCE